MNWTCPQPSKARKFMTINFSLYQLSFNTLVDVLRCTYAFLERSRNFAKIEYEQASYDITDFKTISNISRQPRGGALDRLEISLGRLLYSATADYFYNYTRFSQKRFMSCDYENKVRKFRVVYDRSLLGAVGQRVSLII